MKKNIDRMPTEWEIDQYEQKVQAFAWSFQQDVVSFLRSLHEKNIDLNWAIACIVTKTKMTIIDRKERRDARAEWEKKARRCPDCNRVMYLAKVNDSPGTMVGGGFKTQWLCPGAPYSCQQAVEDMCEFTEFSKRTATEWLAKLRISSEKLKKIRHPYWRDAKFDFVQILDEDDSQGE